ncbi:hypothetical protein D3C76_1666750 [compost metagenome]
MGNTHIWSDRFKKFFINNRFVLFLLVLLLIGLNVLVLNKISFIFTPFVVLIKTVLLPVLLTGAIYYLLNPLVDWLENKGVKRVFTIIGLYLLIIGIITVVVISIVPIVQ